MKPIVEKEESGFYKFNITLATKRGFAIAKIAGTFGIGAAWILAGFKALFIWGDYSAATNESGWIILWIIVTAIIIGLYFAIDETKGD